MARKLVGVLLFLIMLILLTGFPALSQTDPLDHWQWRNPLAQGNNLSGITYGNGIFVAVGYSGTILTSPDGVTWTPKTSGTDYGLQGVAYGNSTFVAVGEFGTIITSPDGATWIARPSGSSSSLRGIAFGAGLFVAVGEKATILISPDGITWTRTTSGGSATLRGVAFGNGTFVAGGDGIILTCPDGNLWTPGASEITYTPYGVSFGNSIFVAVGYASSYGTGYGTVYGNLFTSPNGSEWTPQRAAVNGSPWPLLRLNGIVYANHIFVAVGDHDAVVTSVDGIAWSPRASSGRFGELNSFAYGNLNSVAYGKNSFVAVGNYGGIIQSDPVPASVTSGNAVISESIVTNSLAGGPSDVTVSKVVSFTATNVTGTADFSVEFVSLPTNPVFYKVVGTTWKQLYPKNECSGMSNISLTGTTLNYTMAVTSDCNGTTAANTIVDPLVAGSFATPVSVPGSGGGGGGTGCFIATAAYGSSLHPYVAVLREFRDRVLLASRPGAAFVEWYYRVSPTAADSLNRHPSLKAGVRILLLPLIGFGWLAVKAGLSWTLAILLMNGVLVFIAARRLIATGAVHQPVGVE